MLMCVINVKVNTWKPLNGRPIKIIKLILVLSGKGFSPSLRHNDINVFDAWAMGQSSREGIFEKSSQKNGQQTTCAFF